MGDSTVKIVLCVTLHPQSSVKSLINFLTCYPPKIKFANNEIMKICNYTKTRVLNVNLVSEISYDAS